MRRFRIRAITLGACLAYSASGQGQTARPEIPSNLVLERFAVSNDGNELLIPVTVGGKIYPFVVDTGATGTVFDASIPLGQPIDVVTFDGSEGRGELKLYQPPEARVGRTPLGPLDAVGSMDLESWRQVSGLPTRGVLGMDFLGRYVVHIDIDQGQLLLLKSAPKGAGDELPIVWDTGGHPSIWAEIVPGERSRFIIDTGSVGLDSGSIGVLESASVVRKGRFREIGKALVESMSGTNSRRLIKGGDIRIGDFAVHSPIFMESFGLTPNKLGLRFWSRFAATFDFPERKVYLRKSCAIRPSRPLERHGFAFT